ncbi:bifunctional folylpolyglutamate synthase/dihydrofolate synthase [Novisyntrophococcus fermenticellae]|uniref:bifunctional folylpolyglutamate synthase/dihydrofolate synthase n=1 Tax=Novisyntrophococcus fermenticellae TaxID=2068655 RepID=UPI001E5B8BD1|nr:folylpolyglutamate synthase/dihydrofolate synthase family protein [Novisyntrophococcus fermenticellae]
MNYTEAVNYIEEIPKFTTKNPPEHTRELLRRMGDPHKRLKIIHVAGTNGKGSVCSYLNSMLLMGGCSCGLFTSPHLIKINERYMINQEMVDDALFLEAFAETKKVVDGFIADGSVHPSYFEMLFLMGMYIFKKKHTEYVILETGLGGRLDATNVVEKPLACIITSISRDHTEYLGETISEIAGEKAGIIKPEVPVIYDGHSKEASEVIAGQAGASCSPSYELKPDMYTVKTQTKAGITFDFQYENETVQLQIPYIARYQMMNAALAYFTMRNLEPVHHIPKNVLAEGIAAARWPGRMETVLPGVIIDGAHNEDGVAEFVKTVRSFQNSHKITILFSAVHDKRYKDMIQEIEAGIRPEQVITTCIGGSRGVPAEELAQLFLESGCHRVMSEPDVGHAFEAAYREKGDGMLFCVGSLYLAGELKNYLGSRAGY